MDIFKLFVIFLKVLIIKNKKEINKSYRKLKNGRGSVGGFWVVVFVFFKLVWFVLVLLFDLN